MADSASIRKINLSPCNSIQTVIDELEEHTYEKCIIALEPGVYHEKLNINKSNLYFYGMGNKPEDVVLDYDDYANIIMDDGTKMGTFRSYSVFVSASNIGFENLTIQNSSGDSAIHGQAIALYDEGDDMTVKDCRIIGHQDTIFLGPLPPKEIQPGGFVGPTQMAERINRISHFENTYICGDVDFIFGSGEGYFKNCTIESLYRESETGICGYVTAPSTPEGQERGFEFKKCKFIGPECPAATVYLGRPWRDWAHAEFIDCEYGPHIHPDRFHDWNKPHAREVMKFVVK